jgi:hypothetical protein
MKNIKEFFDEYAVTSINGNANQLSGFYAPRFMFSSKNEVSAFTNDERFLDWLNNLFEFNKKTGLLKIEVKNIDSTSIGEYFTKATVTWASTYSKNTGEEITFDLHYVLNHYGGDFKIILYISETDQEDLMKEKGLL